MIKSLSYKSKQFFFVLIKLSIVVLAFYFICKKLTSNNELSFSKFIELLHKNDLFSLKNTIFLIVLTSFNWCFEILKWRTLVSNIKKITFKDALKQSFGSLTASLFTPNRIGEYGAKAMYYESLYRKRVMGINLIGNLLQMLATTILGIIGFTYFCIKYNIEVNYFKFGVLLFFIISLFLLISFGIKNSTFTFKGASLEKIKNTILKLSKTTIYLASSYALTRYIIFSFQFYVLLQLFNITISYFDAIVVITSMYLLASIIPSIFIFDVVIKGGIAVYLFSFLNINATTILAIVTLMWIYNFVLPSIIGSYYVLNYKLPKSTENQ